MISKSHKRALQAAVCLLTLSCAITSAALAWLLIAPPTGTADLQASTQKDYQDPLLLQASRASSATSQGISQQAGNTQLPQEAFPPLSQNGASSLMQQGKQLGMQAGLVHSAPQGHIPSMSSPQSDTPGAMAQGTLPSFDNELDAITAYLDVLDRMVDTSVLLSGKMDIDEYKAMRTAAKLCKVLDCKPIRQYRRMLELAALPVPPPPTWKKGTQIKSIEAWLVLDYLQAVERAVHNTIDSSQRDDLLPDPRLLERAKKCTTLDCPDLTEYLGQARKALMACGKDLPARRQELDELD